MMDAKTLLDNFEVIAEAPGGVQRLRELILKMAICGRLTKRLANDGSPQELLIEVESRREELYAQGKLRRPKKVVEYQVKALPFGIPSSWEWQPLHAVAICRDGERVPVSRRDREGRQGDYDYYGASGVIDSIDDYIFDEPLLLIGEDGANLLLRSTPIAFIACGKYWVNNHAHVLDGANVDSLKYLAMAVNATDLSPWVTGTAQPKLNQTKLSGIPVPVPPFKEQQRIVAKVNALMSLCDELEKKQQRRHRVRKSLQAASLDALATADSPEALADAWAWVRSNWEALTAYPDTEGAIQQVIRDLAVQGRLSKRRASDGEVVELLNAVSQERDLLTQGGEIRKRGPMPTIQADDAFFSAPDGWAWALFGDISLGIEAGWSPKCDPRPKQGDEWGVLKVSAVSWGCFNPDEHKTLPSALEPRPQHEIFPGDFLMSRANTADLVGRSVVVDKTPGRLMMSDKILRIKLPSAVASEYLNIFMSSTFARQYLARKSTGTSSSMRNISRDIINAMAIPLPSLAEQQRIVAKVNALMSLCDDLEKKQQRQSDLSQRFSEAVVLHVSEKAQ